MSSTVKVMLSRFLSGTGFSPARHASTFAELGSLNTLTYCAWRSSALSIGSVLRVPLLSLMGETDDFVLAKSSETIIGQRLGFILRRLLTFKGGGVKAFHFGKNDFELGFGGIGQDTSRQFEGSLMFLCQSGIWPILCQLIAVLAKLLDMDFKSILKSIRPKLAIISPKILQKSLKWPYLKTLSVIH